MATKTYKTGAQRDDDADTHRYDLIPPHALERIARRFGFGASKYGDDNWQNGQPTCDVLNHLLRHIHKWSEGDRSDDHLAAAAWGLLALMYYEKNGNKEDGHPPRDTYWEYCYAPSAEVGVDFSENAVSGGGHGQS